jgi:hypothetical protein
MVLCPDPETVRRIREGSPELGDETRPDGAALFAYFATIPGTTLEAVDLGSRTGPLDTPWVLHVEGGKLSLHCGSLNAVWRGWRDHAAYVINQERLFRALRALYLYGSDWQRTNMVEWIECPIDYVYSGWLPGGASWTRLKPEDLSANWASQVVAILRAARPAEKPHERMKRFIADLPTWECHSSLSASLRSANREAAPCRL